MTQRTYILCRSTWHIASGDAAAPACNDELPRDEIAVRTTDLVYVERTMKGDSHQKWCARCDRRIAGHS